MNRNISLNNLDLRSQNPPMDFILPKSILTVCPPDIQRVMLTERTVPHVVPSNTPIARKEIEMVLFVGPP